ncbi:fasciclin domain-containing protein [Chitinophaga arvensicola]|uniref:FAS1 domain-containing protein n=1 Tax=Chitinophaga arvensicola TaxID=29529 RepID=A0A1I0R7V2_9BACT|nr:fasciclin domain-containing protein [Chitinophaga arvensicola]SEW36676.1 hypothetical protein SAMN04488122_2416 [Chitinophaga arvensicola]
MSKAQLLRGKTGILGLLVLLAAVSFSACKKDYYHDSGLQSGKYAGSSFEYLQSKPYFFDSIATIVQLAGLEKVLRDSSVTFFAPTDHTVKQVMDDINRSRYENFQDSVTLADVPGEVWQKYLSRYIFRDKYMLKDVPRFLYSQQDLYPGMNLESWQGYVMKLGVLFSDYNGTRDVGPRKLLLIDVGSLETPNNIVGNVASSDMQTRNGIVHVLDDEHSFGFDSRSFSRLVEEYLK